MSTNYHDLNTAALLNSILRPNITHYDVLGLSPSTATLCDIRISYKKLALIFHPDKYVGNDKERALQAFQRINNSYSAISNEDSKREYDRTIPRNNETFRESFSTSGSGTTGGNREESRNEEAEANTNANSNFNDDNFKYEDFFNNIDYMSIIIPLLIIYHLYRVPLR